MNISIAVTTINQIETLQRFLASYDETITQKHELILLDNGSDASMIEFAKTRPDMIYIRNEANVGLYKAYNQIIEASTSDYIAIFHNDIIIHEKGWDARIKTIVEMLEGFGRKIGIVGFAGGSGLGSDGARLGFASNLRDVAELHGRRLLDFMPAVVLDGCALIMNKEMLKAVGGFDEAYKFHHIYDYSISIQSILAGYFNIVIGIDFTHQGGVTACGGDAQKQFNEMGGEQEIMDFNMKRWHDLYDKYLPVYISSGWNLEMKSQS